MRVLEDPPASSPLNKKAEVSYPTIRNMAQDLIAEGKPPLVEWREQVLNGSLRACSLLGLVSNFWSVLVLDLPSTLALTFFLTFVPLHVVAWLPRTSYRLRSWSLLAFTLIPAFLVIGVAGAGPTSGIFLLSATLLVGLVHGERIGYAVFALSSLAWLFAGGLVEAGVLPFPRTYDPLDFRTWWTPTINFFAMGGICLFSVLFALRRTESALREGHEATLRWQAESRKRLQAQQALDETERALSRAQMMEIVGRLAGGAAHDINNAMVVVHGWTDSIRTEDLTPEELKEACEEISRAAASCSRMTHQLLSLGQRDVFAPKAVRLAELVNRERKTLQRLFPSNIELVVDAPSCSPVWADPAQLQQAFWNLCINARDAMRQGGKLTVQVREAVVAGEPHVLLEVNDNGTGMSTETKARIFEPFFSTKGNSGTGLGLAMVRTFVDKSHGVLSVDSQLGQGSTFRISLPVTQARSERQPQMESGFRRLSSGGTVLVVEDDAAVRRLNVATLSKAGYKVVEASDSQEGIERCRRYRSAIDLLLTDGIMPGPPVSQLISAFRQAHPSGRILVCSGYVDDVLVREAVEVGSAGLLPKPFQRGQLLEAIEDLLVPKEQRYG